VNDRGVEPRGFQPYGVDFLFLWRCVSRSTAERAGTPVSAGVVIRAVPTLLDGDALVEYTTVSPPLLKDFKRHAWSRVGTTTHA